MFFDLPLVEMATATSPGRPSAINCRKNTSSTPTSLAMALMLAGSIDSEMAGIGRMPGGGSTQSSTRSLASVAEPPLPNASSVPPAAIRSRIASAAAGQRFGLLVGKLGCAAARRRGPFARSTRPRRPRCRPAAGSPCPRNGYRNADAPTSSPRPSCSKKTCTVSHSVWYMISVISWWMNGSSRGRRQIGARPAGRATGRPARRGGRPRRPLRRVADRPRAGRSPSRCRPAGEHVEHPRGATDRSSAGRARLPTITGWMNSTEMCCGVGGIRPGAHGQQPSAAQKAARHFLAGPGQRFALRRDVRGRDLDCAAGSCARTKAPSDVGGERTCSIVSLSKCGAADLRSTCRPRARRHRPPWPPRAPAARG